MFYVLTLTVAVASTLSWVYLLLGRGGFWRIRKALLPDGLPSSSGARVAVIVPARNEAATIAASLASLLQQSGSEEIHVFVVDDGSADGTAGIARATAVQQGKAGAVTVIEGAPLPPGWSGKIWAMQQGVAAARKANPQFLLFTDADIVHARENLVSLVAFAEHGGYDLASLMVKLHCESSAEKLLIPAFVFFFFKLYPPAWIADPRRTTAGAAGGCLLIRPAALARAGGLEAIRHEIIDDCALARAVKRSGAKVWLAGTTTAASRRAYGGAREIGGMIARSAFKQLHHSTLLLIGTATGMAVTYLAPLALLGSGRPLPIALGAAAWLMMTGAYVPIVVFYGLNPVWALTLPPAAVFYLGATVKSAWNFWSGRGGEWKGRRQDQPPQQGGAVTGS